MHILLFVLIAFPGSASTRHRHVEHRERVDVIELNHVYNENGHVFSQLIYWDWYDNGLHVVAWTMAPKEKENPVRLVGGEYIHTMFSRDGRSVMHIRAKSFRERHTQFDPEIEDRNGNRNTGKRPFPMERRRGIEGLAGWLKP